MTTHGIHGNLLEVTGLSLSYSHDDDAYHRRITSYDSGELMYGISRELKPSTPAKVSAIKVRRYQVMKKIKVSSIQVRKTSTLGNSNSIVGRLNHLQSCKLNYPESANKYYTGFHRHQRQRTKVLANDASENLHGSAVVLPQINGKSFGATLNIIYRFSKVYMLQGTV
ncbi:hypothetical protein L2E82_19143 [Cichorium intybus]|uniref:Uncharacterized protein n=1 Tax=Cichorium intybus TaxID=13427 RepID=A0ACB9FBT8_CICIN|nr:hypothetical protein L2E82_19143 [Cichorium intybus]